MKRTLHSQSIARLPIDALPEGDICPPLDPEHPTWDIVTPWEDPLASRGGYTQPSRKQRVTIDGQPAIAWLPQTRNDRMFVTGDPTWRDLTLVARVQPQQDHGEINHDQPCEDQARARAGLVFRMRTVRQYYTFCIENQSRLILYRRNDTEWIPLASRDVGHQDAILTLRVTLDADGIRAECPELKVRLQATDNTYASGLAGFRAVGACRLFELDLQATPGQQRLNTRLTEALASQTARLSKALPDAIEIGVIDLPDEQRLVACTDFYSIGRNDLLFETPDGMLARAWDGKPLWQYPEPLRYIVFSAEPVDGRRILYALTGNRALGNAPDINVTGAPMERIIHDELLTLDGATGKVLNRITLPVSPREDLVRNYDLSFETGRISGTTTTDILVREWRADWGGGGETLWAYDGNLKPLWQQTVHPGYGHHNAVHFVDIDGDGRDEILAGGTLLNGDGELIWRHDQADEFFNIFGGQHYDAVLAGQFADDPEIDPCAFLVGGSAGVYVVDALSGRTRARHQVGHAQWGMPCRVRADLPGTQIMVGTRWDNYGILTLFSGRGDRLWSIQPDFVLQGSAPVQWVADGPQHIWCCMSLRAMGLYDGYGRRVKLLDKIRQRYGNGTKKPTQVLRKTPEGTDILGLQVENRWHLFGSEP